jgi:antitoxin CptB
MALQDDGTGMIEVEEINRMRWAARRGMLELDLLLEPFAATQYPRLDETNRRSFQRLMRCEDQDLFAWLLQRGEPSDKELVDIVQQILTFARASAKDR